MDKLKYSIADKLVYLANRIVSSPSSLHRSPYYRPVDTCMPGIGHEFSCGAYSYEHLKSLVEQDGPEGFGATCTVAWLIGKGGWQNVADMDPKELRRSLAMSGIDIEEVDNG